MLEDVGGATKQPALAFGGRRTVFGQEGNALFQHDPLLQLESFSSLPPLHRLETACSLYLHRYP
jgi:hypothetical protein